VDHTASLNGGGGIITGRATFSSFLCHTRDLFLVVLLVSRPHQPQAVPDVVYCYTHRDVVWSMCVRLLVTPLSPAKTEEPLEMPFSERTHVAHEPCIRWSCTLAPHDEYDGSICATAAIRPLDTATTETCL